MSGNRDPWWMDQCAQGPYRIEESHDGYPVILGDGNTRVCLVLPVSDTSPNRSEDLNAKLIARCLNSHRDLTSALDECLAAIYGAIEVCGEIGNLTHAREQAYIALERARSPLV